MSRIVSLKPFVVKTSVSSPSSLNFVWSQARSQTEI